MRTSACGLTGAAMIASLDKFNLVNAMMQDQQPDVAADYQALVCIFLSGGTDGNNMVVPYTQYSDAGGYDTVRTASGLLAVPRTALLQISPPESGRKRLGVPPEPFTGGG